MNEENNITVSEEAITILPPAPVRDFSFSEMLLSWGCLVLGFLFCRVFPVTKNSLGGLCFILLLFTIGFFALKSHKIKISFPGIIICAAVAAVALSLFLSSNPFLHFFSYCFCLAAFMFFVAHATNNTCKQLFSNNLFADFLKALLMPFYSFSALLSALFSGKMKRSKKALLKILLGVLLTLVPTVVIFSLLSYDSQFMSLLSKIFNISFIDIVSNVLCVIFGIPIGMYLFGLYISSFDKRCDGLLSQESCHKAAVSFRFLPGATALTAATPPLVIYLIFFISQWGYYVSGFSGTLPGNITYADYAREGFFQLCTVAVINLAIIFLLNIFMKRTTDSPPVSLRIITIIYAIFTLALISTAAAKMIMYINTYGLTPKRVYSSWLIAVIAIIFILVIIKQFAQSFKLLPSVVFVTVLCFAVLALSGTDTLIAKYNVDKYLSRELKTVDVYALGDLGDEAVPEIARLVCELDKENGTKVKRPAYESHDYIPDDAYGSAVQCLHSAALRLENDEKSIFSYTLPKIKAEKALKKIGFMK